MATRIDGKALAAKVKAQVAEKAAKLPRQPYIKVSRMPKPNVLCRL